MEKTQTKNIEKHELEKTNKKGNWGDDMPPRKTARIAGVLYLALIIFGICAELIRQTIIVPGDAAMTASNIMANEGLFRLSFTTDIVAIISFALLPLVLYHLLKKVDKNLMTLVVIFVLISIPVMLVNMVFQYSALQLLSGEGFLSAIPTEQLYAQAMVNINMYHSGVSIATIFHGLWLLPLGYVVIKSGYFPKVFGILQMTACFGLLILGLQPLLAPGFEFIVYPGALISVVAELGFCAWLLVKSVKVPEAIAE